MEETELRAEYCVRLKRGYTVMVWKKFYDNNLGYFWEDVEVYHAGNSPYDSSEVVYHNGLDRNTMMRYARRTAREMLIELGDPDGEIHYSGDLM